VRLPTPLLVTVLALALCAGAQAATLYVAADGSDAADGRSATREGGSGPMASLQAALQRLGRQSGADNEPSDRVILMPGIYVLPQPVVVDAASRGQSGKPLVIMAQTVGSVTLSGGTQLAPFNVEGRVWATKAPRDLPVTDLWVGERRAVQARSPNGGDWFQGGANTSRPVAEDPPLRVSKPATIDNTRRLVLSPAAREALRDALGQAGGAVTGLQLVALHSWASSRQFVTGFDPATGVLSVSPNGRWPFFRFDNDQRYAFVNLPSLLDESGEWWAGPEGTVQYLPRRDDSRDNAQAVVPRLETLLAVRGGADKAMRSVVLRGLRFRYAQATPTPHVDGQASTSVPAAVVADHVQGLEVDQCAFEHLGGYALWLRRGVTDSRVRRSHFHDLGAGGVRVGETTIPESDADRTARNVIENNLIEDGGVTFAGGVGVWIGQSRQNKVVNNEVRDFNYSAISVGWTWGFGRSEAQRNVIAENEIHDIGRGVLNDLGGIYTLGSTDGTVIHNNRIARVTSYRKTGGSTAFGVYLDEGSSNVLVENNVATDTTGGGLHLNYGRDDVVRNNIFAGSVLAQAKRARNGPDATLTFERNVLVSPGRDLYQGQWSDADVHTGRNVLHPADGTFELREAKLADVQKSGHEKGSVESDPRVACSPVECRIDESVAERIGFKPIVLRQVGIVDRGSMLPH
jgi:parallel beta-helix repeat protein